MSDRSEYTDTGNRGPDPRRGFGDEQGTRVGRPDGASDDRARLAPRDASGGQQPGQAGTNAEPVADGIEGSLTGEGAEQERVQRASRGDAGGANESVNPDPESGDERRTFDL